MSSRVMASCTRTRRGWLARLAFHQTQNSCSLSSHGRVWRYLHQSQKVLTLLGLKFHGRNVLSAQVGKIHILRCPALNTSCLGFKLLPHLGPHRCSAGHSEDSPLCAVCEPEYVIEDNTCARCTEFRGGSLVLVCVGGPAALLAVTAAAVRKADTCRACLMVMRLAWPRFLQSFKILTGNLQIMTSVGSVSNAEYPEFFQNTLDAVASGARLSHSVIWPLVVLQSSLAISLLSRKLEATDANARTHARGMTAPPSYQIGSLVNLEVLNIPGVKFAPGLVIR